jgi:hypothetical protein
VSFAFDLYEAPSYRACCTRVRQCPYHHKRAHPRVCGAGGTGGEPELLHTEAENPPADDEVEAMADYMDVLTTEPDAVLRVRAPTSSSRCVSEALASPCHTHTHPTHTHAPSGVDASRRRWRHQATPPHPPHTHAPSGGALRQRVASQSSAGFAPPRTPSAHPDPPATEVTPRMGGSFPQPAPVHDTRGYCARGPTRVAGQTGCGWPGFARGRWGRRPPAAPPSSCTRGVIAGRGDDLRVTRGAGGAGGGERAASARVGRILRRRGRRGVPQPQGIHIPLQMPNSRTPTLANKDGHDPLYPQYSGS